MAKVAELNFLKEPLLTPGGMLGQNVSKPPHTPLPVRPGLLLLLYLPYHDGLTSAESMNQINSD